MRHFRQSGWRGLARGGRWLGLALFFGLPAATAAPPFALEISKQARLLKVTRGAEVVKEYPIAWGRGGRGAKARSGDNKTPTGRYRVVGFKTDSKFHFFMQLNYPNNLDAWRGYRDQLISPPEFRRIALANKQGRLPPQDTRLGGYIGIHGIGPVTPNKLRFHEALNWTEGCIAVKNWEINELRAYVTLGTPVTITE